MKDLFRKLKPNNPKGHDLSSGQITLAAFGKHPGWNDHIPGIGVDTEALAHVRQTLYVDGIGRQIDSGAWEKLEPQKRLEGFDHIFMWLQESHKLLGLLWSSSDGKGRSKYPMVLCADSAGIRLGSLLEIEPELEHLREACKMTNSAGQVTSECNAAQDRIRLQAADITKQKAETTLSVEARRRFFQHGDFGPAGLGLLRVLHEIGSVSGDAGTAYGSRRATGKIVSRHLRLPLASETRINSLHLWAVFLRCAFPKSLSLLFMARSGANWLDLVIGEPANDDFFCLQASPNALPLATEIPYELSPDLKPRLQDLGVKFLALESPTTTVESTASAASPSSEGGGKSEHAKTRPGKIKWLVLLGFVLLTLVEWAGFHFYYSGHFNKTLAALEIRYNGVASANPKTEMNHELKLAPAQELEAKKQQQWYETALRGVRGALGRGNYTDALARADAVLRIKTNDATVIRLKTEAEHQLVYDSATNVARVDFEKGNYSNAINQIGIALNIRSNDPVALQLMTQAQLRMASLSPQSSQPPFMLTSTNPLATNHEDLPNISTNSLGGNIQKSTR